MHKAHLICMCMIAVIEHQQVLYKMIQTFCKSYCTTTIVLELSVSVKTAPNSTRRVLKKAASLGSKPMR